MRVVREIPVDFIYCIEFATDLWWLEKQKIHLECKISVTDMTPEPVTMRPDLMKELSFKTSCLELSTKI